MSLPIDYDVIHIDEEEWFAVMTFWWIMLNHMSWWYPRLPKELGELVWGHKTQYGDYKLCLADDHSHMCLYTNCISYLCSWPNLMFGIFFWYQLVKKVVNFHGGLVVELLAFGSVSKVLGHIKCRYYWKKWFVTWLVKWKGWRQWLVLAAEVVALAADGEVVTIVSGYWWRQRRGRESEEGEKKEKRKQ